MKKQIRISALVFPERKKVGCVLLQVFVKGDRGICYLFNEWETNGSEDGIVMHGTRQEWERLAEQWNEHHKLKKAQ
jgi:hypothetical protein